MKVLLNGNRIYIIYGVAIIIFYTLGFILNENTAASANLDFTLFHYPTVKLFHEHGFFEVIADYPSATTPLFYILQAYFNPFVENEIVFRISNLIFTLFTGYLFFILIKLKYNQATPSIIILLSSIFLISPFIKSEAIWPTTDVLPYTFLFLSLLSFEKLSNKFNILSVFIVAMWISFAYYTRQYYIVFSIYLFYKIIQKYNYKINVVVKTILFFIFLSIPLIYLVYIWGGLNPPQFHFHNKLNSNSIPYIFHFITFYATPMLLILLNKELYVKIKLKDFIEYLLIFCLYLIVFNNFYFYENAETVIQKFSLIIFSGNAELFFLIYSSIGFLFSYYLIKEHFENIILIGSIFFLIATELIFQRYADPLINIVILLLINSSLTKYYLTKNFAYILFVYNFIFYLFMMVNFNFLNKISIITVIR